MSHFELLAMLITTLVIQSALDGDVRAERIIVNLSLFALVLAGIRSLSRSRWRWQVAVGLGVCGLICSMLTELFQEQTIVDVVYVCYLIVFLLLLASLVESVFSLDPSHRDRLVGAISIYLVMALAWAFAYGLLELHRPGSFKLTFSERAGINHNLINETLYFSAATLTTLGYGDIVPLTKVSRMLTAAEAMTGQLYVAIVIAHLVGLRISRSLRDTDAERSSDDDRPE